MGRYFRTQKRTQKMTRLHPLFCCCVCSTLTFECDKRTLNHACCLHTIGFRQREFINDTDSKNAFEWSIQLRQLHEADKLSKAGRKT